MPTVVTLLLPFSAVTVPEGLVLIDKPTGLTSHDVVARVRRLVGIRRVGHAGTLDPMATGVLVLGVGHATRLLTYLVAADKAYTATIRLGIETVTDDAEGEVTARADTLGIDFSQISGEVRQLTGSIQQVPSAVSAVKIAGKRSYARVRAGEQVELTARSVTVHRFDVLSHRRHQVSDDGGEGVSDGAAEVLDLSVAVEVSSGTYIRALARDLGRRLGVGGHLTALRRTRVGPYRVDQTRSLEEFAANPQLLPLADAARATFPPRELDEDEVRELRFGRRIAGSRVAFEATLSTASVGPVAGFAPDGSLVALLEDVDAGDSAKSLLVIPAK